MPVAKLLAKIARNMRLVPNRNPYLIAGGVRPSPQQGGKVVATINPTVRQRELGRRLREQRLEHDLTVEEVADKLLCSATKISRLETGARRPSLRDVRDLCGLYDVGKATADEFMDLARGAREQVWWTQYEDLKLDPYLGLEEVATAITSFTTFYLPALLQTEEYTREVIKKVAPKMEPDIYRQRVEVRMRRQKVLEGDNRPRYRVLLDESVLRRPVGEPALMVAQIDKILQAERDGKATIQIIPFDFGVPAAQDSNFVLLEFDDTTKISPTVFVEGLTGNQYLERKAEVDRYKEAIDYLRYSAFNAHDSAKHITEMRKRYGGD
jgi:transcriptional regulator with XRE-family HTH domain